MYSRILSRDTSAYNGSTDSGPTEQDLEITPPGTPALPLRGRSPLDTNPIRTAGPPDEGMASEVTPPGTPILSGRSHSHPRAGQETSKVKEMRERVQEMTTGDLDAEQNIAVDDNLQQIHEEVEIAAPAISSVLSSGPSSPPIQVEEEIADMPASASAAEAEKQADFTHEESSQSNNNHHDEDVIISESEDVTPPLVVSTSPDMGVDEEDKLPPSAPLKMAAVATLGRSSSLFPPPSPASSIRAETGSNAGDSDYLSTTFEPNRFSASRMTSLSSMKNAQNIPSSLSSFSSSSSLSSHHLHLHSSLPRSASGLDNSDALSDISTEANPPGTPRPMAELDAPSAPPTPLAARNDIYASGAQGTQPPPPTPADTRSVSPTPTPISNPVSTASTTTTNAVQANFGRPTSFAPMSTSISSSTPAKAFVNPFSSFGNFTSPFASSSSVMPSVDLKSATNAPSDVNTAKPFASVEASESGSASPFASAGASSIAGRNAFNASTLSDYTGEFERSEQEQDQRVRGEEDKENNKVFSSQAEIQIFTGEEDEFTQYAVPRAKLYIMDGTEWKERGVGQIKLNSKADRTCEKLSVRLGEFLISCCNTHVEQTNLITSVNNSYAIRSGTSTDP